ncbi:chemotaxis protein CheB [Sideroxydans sp. CL21]|uniref:chemotaxis protein CheB n=1 Tax=Sideroxydans sp. CL21 TaxID=2600596 RepID=UPI0024BC2E12|nr:chemotaxis protein CheB [Sideroxydans sp. CL21]
MTIKKVVKNLKKTPAEAKPIDTGFNIVGIGASAGGLEAFEQFFRSTPPDSGMAFVLVSHLDPDHASLLTEILQRASTMPVVEAQDQMKVEPNYVYVLPPNRDMAIFHGNLQLSTPEMPRGQRMVIDSFLRSLAEDQGEKAIGIILSGTGTDGTLGLRAIQGAGGITLVQEPATAKYDGMPVSAIHAGYATYTLPVEKMPEQLLSNKHNLLNAKEIQPTPAGENSMNRILMLLRSGTGNDFSLYKKSTIGRRIERRMSQHNIESMDLYARYLKEHPVEVHLLFKELLINVTSFFRDAEAFLALKQDILPLLLKDKPESYVFRVWVAGCATGEEAYSIAILLRELMDETGREFKTQIYSTDLDDDAIAVARAGIYPPNIVQDVTTERLRRFFIKEDTYYRVKKDIREMVVFATQNIIKDPPFTKLDLLSCRNLMIYLEPELQNRVIPAFHYALKPGGVLFLSPSESIGSHVDLFTALNRKWKLYQSAPTMASARAVMSSGLSWTKDNPTKGSDEVITKIKETDFAELTRRALLQSYAPASVVANLKGDILFVHGDTGKYLRPAPGQATLNIIEMAREGLQLELRNAIQAATEKGVPTLNRVASFGSNGDLLSVSFSVRLLPVADTSQNLLLVSFQDMASAQTEKPSATATAAKGKSARGKAVTLSAEQQRIGELERDLSYIKENLHATIEEQQASNEELKSTNEEMQSTNEELQSTNEELETSKEELQSVNEELVTVNAELQNKIEQLAGMQNDMKNLLDNINIGTIFLNDTLNIKRFTREAVKVYRLVASDMGRPLGDIKSNIKDDDLLADAQAVLDSLVPREREVFTTGGEWFLARTQPYRTLDNVIDGVVLTFTDITKRIQAETAMKDARELSESIVDTVREPLVVLDAKCKIISASRSFYENFKVEEADTVGRQLYELGNRQWDIPKLRELLETELPSKQIVEGFEVVHDFPVIGKRKMLLNARRITGKSEGTPLILLAMEEVK